MKKKQSNRIVIEPKNEDIDEDFFNTVVKDIESYIEEKYGNVIIDTTLQESITKIPNIKFGPGEYTVIYGNHNIFWKCYEIKANIKGKSCIDTVAFPNYSIIQSKNKDLTCIKDGAGHVTKSYIRFNLYYNMFECEDFENVDNTLNGIISSGRFIREMKSGRIGIVDDNSQILIFDESKEEKIKKYNK